MTDNTLSAQVEIRFVPMQSGQPKRLQATADFVLYFRGALPDMKITGLSLWRGEDAALALTLPAGVGSAGEYYCFRPLSGDLRDVLRFEAGVLEAYHAWVAGQGDRGGPGPG